MSADTAGRRSGASTIIICFLAALVEGADIVSMGLAAPSVAKAFHFNPAQVSYILTATVLGLMVGAALGGRLGDRIGRKRVMIGAFVVLGLFSVLTAHAGDLPAFAVVRCLAGLGIGAAFPNLIAIAAEASRPDRRATGVGLMFAGQPMGGMSLGLFVASQARDLDWTHIFYIGGIAPLLLLPVLIFALPESETFQRARQTTEAPRPPSAALALFGEGRTLMTLLLWVAYGFTQVVVYLMNNWLPTLMVAKGFTPQQAGMISAIENAGAILGCVILAMITDRGRLRPVLVVTYIAIAAGLWGLGAAQGFATVAAVGVVVGFFAIGGQLVLYTLAPAYYPTLVRATGVGAAVSFGRLGGIAGPLVAGQLLALNLTPAAVLISAMPCAVLAGLAAVGLTFVRRPEAS
ncbi:3-(3-hydroxy-phenyl)propionate transporter MhpT [Caulobacter sp.]|uniref:3-(3-hydroxy-phenyl)propionate transporter MhpT n=1 Tax=Caulobacter sp. TaxID=78 RepID=UPI0031DA849A